MDLFCNSLVEHLKCLQEKSPAAFPGGGSVDYFRQYKSIEEWLNNQVHGNVGMAALYNGGVLLTDHGPKHIAKVIERASRLVESQQCVLEPYEVYVLLAAIQFHDAGNIYGRLGHEGRISDILEGMGTVCGEDTTERRCIVNVAQAHGGEMDGDKDTIGRLSPDGAVLGKKVRFRLLASILRFADELADERERAVTFLQRFNAGAPPRASEAYHRFAESLHSVEVKPDDKEVSLSFDIRAQAAKQRLGKEQGEVYLLDEIFDRTLKTHIERVYCSRFMRPDIDIEAIKVKIEICDNRNAASILETIDYRLLEKGYPDTPSSGIHGLCPELGDWKGRGRLDGASFHRSLEAAGGEV